jgi:predicted Zn-dependent protease with MMP-like domain
MKLQDFESMVARQTSEVPAEFLDGIVEVVVSPRTVPHPERGEIWTLGECIPLPGGEDGDPRHLRSRIVLYHGSFQALARDTTGFDWNGEAWETLTHEIRHHVEWRARVPDLEAFDQAAEANFSRQDGGAFDPAFYKDGVKRPDGAYQVDDDVFVERVVSAPPPTVRLHWLGDDYEIAIPEAVELPAFLTLDGERNAPPGELVLARLKRGGWLGLFKRPKVFQAEVEARKLPL